ncbi:hypothetical protein DIPPA_27497 [Diplonema papillatum]|nr:hypothetical protein DIPPA_27497 [Diplonema papillatum]
MKTQDKKPNAQVSQLTHKKKKKQKEVSVRDARSARLESLLCDNRTLVNKKAADAEKKKRAEKHHAAQEKLLRIGMLSFEAVRRAAKLAFQFE